MNRMNMKVMKMLLVLFSFFLTVGAISANAITVSGVVKDTSGAAIAAGVSVTGYWGAGSSSTAVVTYDGDFTTLDDIPANTPFFLMFTSAGYIPVYTQFMSKPSSFTIGEDNYGGFSPITMPTGAELAAQGVLPDSGKSVLMGRVVDTNYSYSSYVEGVVVAATSGSTNYTVVYMGFNGLGGTSTHQNGKYFVLNVSPGTQINLQASKPGWTFSTPTASFYPPPGPTRSEGTTRLKGTAAAYDRSISGSVNSISTGPIPSATIALNGDPLKDTTSMGDGTFTLGDLPKDATFYLKVTADTYAPTYVGPITLQNNISDASFVTMTPAEMAARGVTGSNGFVMGRVLDQTGTPIIGATIVVASKMGQTYAVSYNGGGSSTNATGQFGIPNVQPNDSVRIQVTSAGFFFAPVTMDCWANSITETPIFETIPSVDVSQIYYSDSIRTVDNYDFSTGTKSGDTITIPGGFVTKPGAESGLSYTFGLFGTGYTLSWTAPNPCTIKMSGDPDGAVVIAATPALPDESSAQTAWDFRAKLQNFTAISSATDSITYFAGMGSPEGVTNQPSIEVTWLVNGHLQLTARVGEYDTPVWQATPVDLGGGLPSVATALELRLQNTGTAINFYYTLNSGTETLIDTFGSGDGYVAADYKGFPVLFPFVNLETESTSPVEDLFHVTSVHWNNVSIGNEYHANVFVDDPGQTTYESISVAGSGAPCGDNVPSTVLTYNGNGQWWLSPSVFLSEDVPPGCYPSYTFTALKKVSAGGGTVSETRTVTGYVETFATDLLPAGTIITGAPTFSWSGIIGASGYRVEVSDSGHNNIWNAWVDAPTAQTVYTGPALTSGQTYYYYVNANVSTNGTTNISVAEGSFTYSASSSLYADFADTGLNQWNGTTWTQLTNSHPASMVASGTSLYVDFAGDGLYKWNGSGFSLLTRDHPASMVASGTSLYAGFAGYGLYQWNGSTWITLTNSNPASMVASGTSLYAGFAGYGLYQWNGSTWITLTNSNPASMVASGTSLYAGFAGYGLYQWNGSTWITLTNSNPASMVASGTSLYADFAAYGLFEWNGSTWITLTNSHPASMVASDTSLYVDFAGDGLYQWSGSTWTKLTNSHPTGSMVASGTSLYVDFAGDGLYEWNGSAWTKLINNHPARMVAGF